MGDRVHMFTPYLLAGLSGFFFIPKADLGTGSLNIYGTEGQGLEGQGLKKNKYLLVQMAVPYGIGIRVNFRDFWNFGVEVANRKTFTDYLDDVSTAYVDNDFLEDGNGQIAAILADKSDPAKPIGREGKQRGNSRDNDSYLFMAISFTYTIRYIRCYEF